MPRVGPLVLHTYSSIDDTKQSASAKLLKQTLLAPKRQYDEEIERQHFTQLRNSKDDVVVVFGERIEHFRRKHITSYVSDRSEEGFQSPANKPYVPVGGKPQPPESQMKRFRFIPEKERRTRRAVEKKKETEPEPSSPTRGGERPPEGPPSPAHSLRSGAVTSPRSVVADGPSKAGCGTHGSGGDSPRIAADRMLELLFNNPAKARAIRDKQNRIGTFFLDMERRSLKHLPSKTKTDTLTQAPLLKLDAKDSLVKGTIFPKAEFLESRERIGLTMRGESLMETIPEPPDFDQLFPVIDLSQPPPPSAHSARTLAGTKDVGSTFMTQLYASDGTAISPPPPDAHSSESNQLEARSSRFLTPTPRTGECEGIGFSGSIRCSFPPAAVQSQVESFPSPDGLDLSAISDGRVQSEGQTPTFVGKGARLRRVIQPDDKIYNFGLWQIERFDEKKAQPTNPNEFSGEFWHLRFAHHQYKLQSQLVHQLDQRHQNRDRVYGDPERLSHLCRKSGRHAEDWSVCRRATSHNHGGRDLWTNCTELMDQDATNLQTRVDFYRKIANYLQVMGFWGNATTIEEEEERTLSGGNLAAAVTAASSASTAMTSPPTSPTTARGQTTARSMFAMNTVRGTARGGGSANPLTTTRSMAYLKESNATIAKNALQTMLDRIRSFLVRNQTVNQTLLFDVLSLYGEYPAMMKNKKTWALVNFLRHELNVDVYEIVDHMKRQLGLHITAEQVAVIAGEASK